MVAWDNRDECCKLFEKPSKPDISDETVASRVILIKTLQGAAVDADTGPRVGRSMSRALGRELLSVDDGATAMRSGLERSLAVGGNQSTRHHRTRRTCAVTGGE